MKGQSQDSGKKDDGLLIGMIMTVMLVAGAYMMYNAQATRINSMTGAISWFHVKPFALAVEHLPVLRAIPLLGDWLLAPAATASAFLERGGYALMTTEQRNAVLTASGRCAIVTYLPIFAWVVLRGRGFRVDRVYRRRHDIESMIAMQSEIWPTTRLCLNMNPLKEDGVGPRRLSTAMARIFAAAKTAPGIALPRRSLGISPSVWDRALRPEEWLLASGVTFDPDRHAGLVREDSSPREKDFEHRPQWERLSLGTIEELLSEQLRTPWTSPAEMRLHQRALFAVMSLFHAYDTAGGNALLSDTGVIAGATTLGPGRMDAAMHGEAGFAARIDRICESKAGRQMAIKGKGHAWLESAFPTFLAAARKDRGVLAAASFLWLKTEDRQMWYILNNVGNEAVMVEAAGAMAHSRAEIQIGRPLRRPSVYQAARAIHEDYLDLTPERIELRRAREEHRRTPGRQMELLGDTILNEVKPVDIDGIEE